MPVLPGGDFSRSTTTELEIINKKRLALQRLVRITNMLGRLHQGLQAVILMGRSAAQIPGQIIEKFNSLRKKLDGMPTPKLRNTLSSTEQRLHRDLKWVLEVSQKTDRQLSEQLGRDEKALLAWIDDHVQEHVDDFRKKGQTSVALRIALKARNVIMQAAQLPVPTSLIEKQIHALEQREQECRRQVNTDIDSLQQTIQTTLSRDDCPDELREKLSLISTNLAENRDHIAAGKDLENMPILYESIEISGAPQVVEEIERQSAADEESVLETIAQQAVKRGFFERLWEWLNTPAGVKWKDIKKYR